MKEGGHESRFNTKRIAFHLKAEVIPYTGRNGVPGFYVKKGGQDALSPSSSLAWTDTEIIPSARIPGNATLTTQPGATVFTSETGASVTYYSDGSFIYAASLNSPVSRRERLRLAQAGLPWWQKDREVVENTYVHEAGRVAFDPVFGNAEKKGTPYKHFKLSIPVSETETKECDVYAYGQAIGLVNRRNIHKDDIVRLRASVQFHEQRLPHGRSIFVPWLNLFDVQKIQVSL